MDMKIVGDVISLDPELLQLPELSPLELKTSPQIAKELFAQWLSLPDTGGLVKSLVNDAKTGTSFGAPGDSSTTNASGNTPLPSLFPAGSAPPLSPRSAVGSSRTMKQRSTLSSLGSPLKLVSEPVREVIPQFYFQDGPPAPKELREHCVSRIDDFFNGSVDGLQVHEFKSVTKDVCKLPSFISTTLFLKIDTNCTGIVTRDAFIKYWVNSNMLTLDIATQIFKILKQPDCKYLTQADFKSVL